MSSFKQFSIKNVITLVFSIVNLKFKYVLDIVIYQQFQFQNIGVCILKTIID